MFVLFSSTPPPQFPSPVCFVCFCGLFLNGRYIRTFCVYNSVPFTTMMIDNKNHDKHDVVPEPATTTTTTTTTTNDAHNPSSSPSSISFVAFDYSHQSDPVHGTSTTIVATFNLVATIVGGGVLSVPYAFMKCGGALWGILGMIVAALATDQTCWMLCWCARPSSSAVSTTTTTTTTTSTRTINTITATNDNNNNNNNSQYHDTTPQILSSYGQVGREAFGPVLEVTISALLFVFLVFVLIAYMVLVKDIWTPIILLLAAQSTFNTTTSATATAEDSTVLLLSTTQQKQQQDETWGPYVLLGILLFMSPFLVQRTLYALRFNCYIGFASVSILCLALCYHAVVLTTATAMSSINNNNILWTRDFWLAPPNSVRDVLVAFPILMLSFLCHFNVNPIQKALYHPTPERINGVIHGAMVYCGLLMTIFGVAGYAYVAGSSTTSTVVQGNILLNCEEQQASVGNQDILLWSGRIGCGITIMLAMAIMILPCRDSLLEVLDIIVYAGGRASTPPTSNEHDKELFPTEETALMSHRHEQLHKPLSLSERPLVHYVSTLLIVIVCYVSAIKAPGVAIIWSLCGSSMAFCIAFALPTACFLKILHKREQYRDCSYEDISDLPTLGSKALAWILLVCAIVAAIICTMQTIESMVS